MWYDEGKESYSLLPKGSLFAQKGHINFCNFIVKLFTKPKKRYIIKEKQRKTKQNQKNKTNTGGNNYVQIRL